MPTKTNRLIGAVLLVSGTTIGAGMLALPVTTGLAGFFPSLLIMGFIWLYMMLTAYYLLEVNLRIRGESNLISMMDKTLGSGGQLVSWIVYLLLLYALLAAYMVGCSQILKDLFPLPYWGWPVVTFVIFAVVVYFGALIVDMLNRVMMVGLFVAYGCFLFMGSPHISFPLLTYVDWGYLLPSLSVVLTTFGYHIIIPTLTTYLEHDVKLLKWSIFLGSLIPFVIYILWQTLVMGLIPVTGELSLSGAAASGEQVSSLIRDLLNSPKMAMAARFFAFFAIVTSLLGVSLSLHDFLADGLKIKKSKLGKFFIILLTFFPPLFFTLFYPQGFVMALRYAGIFVVILLALLPTAMAYSERYGQKSKRSFIKSEFIVFGGKPLLVCAFLLSLILLGVEILG